MKRLKSISFCIGFMMLFCAPAEGGNWLAYALLWLPLAVGLIGYSGAFKSSLSAKRGSAFNN